MNEPRARRLFFVVAAYFVLAVVASAIGWGGRFDERMLERRHWDYGWELLLPWEASQGRWSARDFVYPIGPLWQLLAWLPNLGARFVPARAVAGLHLVFPLLSLVTAASIAIGLFRRWPERTAAFATLALLGLHDDVRSLRALLPLAALLAFAGGSRNQFPAWRRGIWVGALLACSSWLSLDAGLLGLAGVATMGTVEALAGAPRPALARLGSSLGTFVVAQALLLSSVGSAGVARFVRGATEVIGAYGTTMISASEGFDPTKLAVFFGLGALPLLWLLRGKARDVGAATWLLGSLPFAVRALLRSDAEHAYAACVPLVGVLCLLAIRHARERMASAVYAGLVGSIFILGWLGSHPEQPRAWHPSAFARAREVLLGRLTAESGYRGDFHRVRTWLQQRKDEGVSCVGLPPSAVALHAMVGVHGPTEISLGWSYPLQLEMAERVRAAHCPWFVQEVVSFDEGSWGFGEYMLAVTELYEPVERLGPDLFASRLRKAPAPARRSPLGFRRSNADALQVPGEIELAFERPVAWDHAIAIEYHFDVSLARRLVGGTPALQAQFFAGTEPIGPPMSVPYATVGRARTLLPVDPAVAEERWVVGRAPKTARYADRLVLSARGNRASPAAVGFDALEIVELEPGTEPAGREPGVCSARLDLLSPAVQAGSFFRAASPGISGDALELEPAQYPEPDAEWFVPMRPCADTCLFAELGVGGNVGDGDGVDFEVHVIDAHERPRLIHWHADAGVSPKPAELPLGNWAERDVLVRFGTRSGPTHAGDRARVLRARLRPCAARTNLVVGLHDGRYASVRGQSEVRGDTLRLATARHGGAPSEIRIPLLVLPGSCLAAQAHLEEAPPGTVPVAVDLGVLEGKVVTRLARPELTRDAPPVALKDLALERWAGREVELRIAAWALEDGPLPVTVVSSLRVHGCGDGAPWGFGGGAD